MAKAPHRSITRRTATFGLGAGLLWTGASGPWPRARADSQRDGPAAGPFEWEAAPVPARLDPARTQEADRWLLRGKEAPFARIRLGDELRLHLTNRSPIPLSLHLHGMRGPNAMDGVGGLTQDPLAPGAGFEYRFTPPDAGTFLIRPCVLGGGSAEPAERGLTGLLVVEEITPPSVDRDVPILVDDWRLTDEGALAPFDPGPGGGWGPSGRLGNWLTVNGNPLPLRVEVPTGGRVRLRLANACNARIMRLRFDGLKPFVVAVDGQPTDTFEPLRASLPFPPGTRYDLLVDVPADAGATGSVKALIGDGLTLVEIVAGGPRAGRRPAMAPIPTNKLLPDSIKLQSAARAEAAITGGAAGDPAWLINGRAGSPGSPPLIKVRRGSPVVLTLDNRTPFPQPFHLHGHSFRLLHPLDDGWEPYFLDTLQVPEKRIVRIAFVADNPGRWLIASTVLERFDAGLWAWIEVT